MKEFLKRLNDKHRMFDLYVKAEVVFRFPNTIPYSTRDLYTDDEMIIVNERQECVKRNLANLGYDVKIIHSFTRL